MTLNYKSIISTSLLHLMLFLFIACIAQAQEIFKTKDGDVIVNSAYNNEKFSGESQHLFAVINYETTEILLSLDPTTLRTKPDSFNVCFKSQDADKLNQCIQSADIPISTLKGKLNVPNIITSQNPDYNLNFEAEFQLNDITRLLYVTGTLKNLKSEGMYCCLLTLDFHFRLRDFNITPPENFSEIASVQIRQVVLERDNP